MTDKKYLLLYWHTGQKGSPQKPGQHSECQAVFWTNSEEVLIMYTAVHANMSVFFSTDLLCEKLYFLIFYWCGQTDSEKNMRGLKVSVWVFWCLCMCVSMNISEAPHWVLVAERHQNEDMLLFCVGIGGVGEMETERKRATTTKTGRRNKHTNFHKSRKLWQSWTVESLLTDNGSNVTALPIIFRKS